MKKQIKKTVILLLALAVACLFGLAGCKKNQGGGIEIKLTEEAFRPNVYVNREFDVMELVEDPDDSLTYSLTECYYLDGSFERQDITVNGTKFTSTLPTTVYCTLKAQAKKGATAEAEFEVDVKVPSNALQEGFITSWNDNGVAKTITADPEYLHGDAETAVKVTYSGTYNPVNDGVNVGSWTSDAKSNLSLPGWSNAVISLWVYNAADFDLTLGMQFTKDGEPYNNLMFVNVNSFTLKAGEWTHAYWSLRRMEMVSDLWEDGIVFGFKIHANDKAMGTKIDYSVSFCDMDIADYDATAFPNLETRTDEEIFDQMPGDRADKLLSLLAVKNTETEVNQYYHSKGDAEAAAKPCPEVDGSESSVKYTYRRTKTEDQCVIPVIRLKDIDEEFMNTLSIIKESGNWKNAYIGFWIYNDTGYEVGVATSALQCEYNRLINHWFTPKNAVQGEWTYVEIAVSSIALQWNGSECVQGNMFGYEDGQLHIYAEVFGAETGKDLTVYIDGFDIYEKARDKNTNLLELAYKDGVNGSTYTAEIDETMHYGDAERSVKYTFTEGENAATTGGYRGRMAYIASDAGGGLMNTFEITSWKRLKVGFWVYNNSGRQVEFNITARAMSVADDTLYGDSDLGFKYNQSKPVYSKDEWQYVEFDVYTYSSLNNQKGINFNLFDPALYKNYGICIGTEIAGGGTGVQTSYNICDFTVFSEQGDESDILVKAYAANGTDVNGNYYKTTEVATIDSKFCPSVTGSTTSVKHSIKYEGVESCYAAPIRLTDCTADFIDGLSIVKNSGDWSNAYLGFWIYNESDYDVKIGCSRAVGGILNDWFTTPMAAKDGWSYVEVKLSHVKAEATGETGVTTNLFEIPNYCFNILAVIDPVPSGAYEFALYIDGFDIYEGSRAQA